MRKKSKKKQIVAMALALSVLSQLGWHAAVPLQRTQKPCRGHG